MTAVVAVVAMVGGGVVTVAVTAVLGGGGGEGVCGVWVGVRAGGWAGGCWAQTGRARLVDGRLQRRCRALAAGRVPRLTVGDERTLVGEVAGAERRVRCRLVSLTRTEAECGWISTLDLW